MEEPYHVTCSSTNRWPGADPEDTPLPHAELRHPGKAALNLERWYETVTELPGPTQVSHPRAENTQQSVISTGHVCKLPATFCQTSAVNWMRRPTGVWRPLSLTPNPRSSEQKPHLSYLMGHSPSLNFLTCISSSPGAPNTKEAWLGSFFRAPPKEPGPKGDYC